MKCVKLLEEFAYSKSSNGVELKVIGKGDLHSLDQVLIFHKETCLEKMTLEKCPPLELKHLLMLTSLRTLIIGNSVGLAGPLGGGQSDVEWQLPVDNNRGRGCDGVLLVPVHLYDSLQELEFINCQELVLVDPPTLVPGGGGLQALRSLHRLTIQRSPKFLSTFSFSRHIFPSSLQSLELWGVEGLGTLEPLSNLSSLTRLELGNCREDLKCQGLWSLLTSEGQLNKLKVLYSPRFFAGWDPYPRRALDEVEGEEERQTQLVSSTLRELCTDDETGLLSAPICSFLSSSLTMLQLSGDGSVGNWSERKERFSKEQEDALQLLCSLQEPWFTHFDDLQHLPAGLGNLTNLKILSIIVCPAVSSLPNDGLPKSLQELNVRSCRNEKLKQQCRGLVGTIPKIIIDY
ncbi:uncharacterized protein LOC119345244 [Triticum dicoccoides]|uniref:uncharacterized protein LOC119345244 n=1 Tax=Triticum dicoccoides TaxID=85692 RepID=UPI00188EAA0D|nr:uncharacterized protein LOC119345244 [Triticum dicoccoides]